jgi:hypothetical protein
MSLTYGTAWVVVYRCADLRGDVLNQCAAAPGVKRLQALTDGEDRFVEIKGILEEEFVDGGARGVSGSGLGLAGDAVFFGVDVGGAAGEEDALDRGEDAGDALGRLVERNGDGGSSGGVEGVEILRERALVVGDVEGGGLRDGDVYGLR